MRRSFITLAVIVMVMAITTPAFAANPHWVGTPTCTVSGETLTCSGKVAGLGKAPTTVTLDADFECINPGGHVPGGHVSSTSEPIKPRGGAITFSESVAAGDCPPPMTPSFGDEVTITIVQDGAIVFQDTVPIT